MEARLPHTSTVQGMSGAFHKGFGWVPWLEQEVPRPHKPSVTERRTAEPCGPLSALLKRRPELAFTMELQRFARAGVKLENRRS
jgi:hypothetical protein